MVVGGLDSKLRKDRSGLQLALCQSQKNIKYTFIIIKVSILESIMNVTMPEHRWRVGFGAGT